MKEWPDRRILDLFGIELPIILAPMAGPGTAALAIGVSEAGGLGSLPCAQLSSAQIRAAIETIRRNTSRPINVNFFCHMSPTADAERERAWRARLKPYYLELGLDPEAPLAAPSRRPFDREACALVEEFKPEVVSFHFGLPSQDLLDRVKATKARVIGSATTVREAQWLESHGCDAVIAMGLEAGGHRGNFLSDDMARQVGTFALVPQIADAIKVPVIAAGGIADARGIVAALALCASAVQIGTAYLFCPEAQVSPLHLEALTTGNARRRTAHGPGQSRSDGTLCERAFAARREQRRRRAERGDPIRTGQDGRPAVQRRHQHESEDGRGVQSNSGEVHARHAGAAGPGRPR
jgi:nitronate monooxygenase